MKPQDIGILVLSDMPVEARQIVSLLADNFPLAASSTDESRHVDDFDARKPDILLLAFRHLELAERHALGLLRHSEQAGLQRHHCIVLCDKDNLRQAFALCRKQCFDDYVLYWPLVHDSARLHMSILIAGRLLTLSRQQAAAGEVLAQARVVGALGDLLDAQLRDGEAHSAALGASLDAACAAADALTSQFAFDADGVPSGMAAPPPAAAIAAGATAMPAAAAAPEPATAAAVRSRVRAAAECAIPLNQWVEGLRRDVSPQLDAARRLQDMAAHHAPLVLVVDDDEFQCKLLARLLDGFACRLQFAHSGAEAFTALSHQRPDLILMDVDLPDCDGVAITRQLKANPALAAIPVIMITGHAERPILEASLSAGAADFVVKPFERSRLLAKLGRFLHARSCS